MERLISLIDRKEIAEGTTAFWFDVADSDFSFKAGQYVDISLIDPLYTDAEGSTRSFSIASSPNDRGRIMIATRMRPSAFKNSLKEAPIGYVVKATDPMGSLTLHKDTARPAVFIAGGIGITPFRSMAAWANEEGLPHKIYLFYSNRSVASAPFLEEFRAWAKDNKNFHFIPTLTGETAEGFESGRITAEMLRKHVARLDEAVTYLAGPPAMVSGLLPVLTKAGANEDFIKTEDFAGY